MRRDAVSRYFAGDSPRNLAWATGLGAASSSCSYAAVALARSLFRKGASLSAAVAFEIASTNLVLELGIILALFMGWQFTLAEFVGGPLMILLVALGFRLWMRRRIVDERTVSTPARAHTITDHMGRGTEHGVSRKVVSDPAQPSR